LLRRTKRSVGGALDPRRSQKTPGRNGTHASVITAGNHRFWRGVAALSIGFAGMGLVAVLAPLWLRDASGHPSILLDLLWAAQMLGVPLWILAFALFAAIAATRSARRLLFGAIGIEIATGVCVAIHWFVPSAPL
jgi:hypothetical protein